MKREDSSNLYSSNLTSGRLYYLVNSTLFRFGYIVTMFTVSSIICFNPLSAQQVKTHKSNLININCHRELFLDGFIIGKIMGKAELRLHNPIPQEIVLRCDNPWEGSGSNYFSIFKDGNLYRMYYRGVQVQRFEKGHENETDANLYSKFCYAESNDGIHWIKPNLGIYDFDGSKNNNIVLASGDIKGLHLDLSDNASFFKDKNPNATADARYKAIVCSAEPRGLLAFKSSDAIHWEAMSDNLIITDGAFDSQNLAFWDSERKVYRAYWRYFKESNAENRLTEGGVRAIRSAVSTDFIHWYNHADLQYLDTLQEHLYTNQILPYYRAPYLLIGFPTRYNDKGWSESMRSLPELQYRKLRSSVSSREGTAVTDGLIMASLDGLTFKRWNEAFLRPGIERPGTWNYGQQYQAWGLIETKSALEGAPNELSLYATEEYQSQQPIGTRLRRYTLRLDGFVSVNAPMTGGSLLTKLIRFQGKQLSINFSTSAAGSIQVELRDTSGKPIPGFTLTDSSPIFGDSLDRIVKWKNGSDVSSLQGKPVTLYFILKDADLYSFKF